LLTECALLSQIAFHPASVVTGVASNPCAQTEALHNKAGIFYAPAYPERFINYADALVDFAKAKQSLCISRVEIK
jgi:hypothetical protein